MKDGDQIQFCFSLADHCRLGGMSDAQREAAEGVIRKLNGSSALPSPPSRHQKEIIRIEETLLALARAKARSEGTELGCAWNTVVRENPALVRCLEAIYGRGL